MDWMEVADMKRVAKFEKVSLERYLKDFEQGDERRARQVYDSIQLPRRATKGSAGYDFFLPYDVTLKPGETAKIPTGIRVSMNEDYVLKLYPRSSLGFRYRLQLNNTVGIIDSDYYYADNEGHVFAKITNDGTEGKTVELKAGDGFMQGIFLEYGITVDDEVQEERHGGLGSTSRKSPGEER